MESSLSDYEIISPLGTGAYSHVYKVKSHSTGEQFALKVIAKSTLSDLSLTNRLINEIQIQSSLDHPSIVKLLSFFEDTEKVYLLLELCEGELHTYIQSKGPLSEEETRLLLSDLLDGLLYLHDQGIIHRDLKLGNLFVSKDKKHLKIGDFGLSIKQNQLQFEKQAICGTPNYISPEVMAQKAYGLSSDIWSLGCILYACLTGSPPFESQSVETTFRLMKEHRFTIPESISDSAKDLIVSLLRWEPDDRPSIREVKTHSFFSEVVYYEYYESRKPLRQIKPKVSPLNTTNLKPMKHKTAKSELEINSEGSLKVTVKRREIEVSPDGLTVFYKNRHYSYRDLPAAAAKLYGYAKKVIDTVKSKTPKVIVQDRGVRFMMMMDSPFSTFEADFVDGTRVQYQMGTEQFQVIRLDKVFLVNPYQDLDNLEAGLYKIVTDSMEGLKKVLAKENNI